MKKILFICGLLSVFLLVGCNIITGVGKYKEGTYMGSDEYTSYGKKYVTTAVVYVDFSGMIKSVYIDSTYFKNEVYTTKKVLKDAYGMKGTSASTGNIPGGAEWYEQINTLEDEIVLQQGIEWLKYNDEGKTDSVAGVTITVDSYYKAVNNALEQAKK